MRLCRFAFAVLLFWHIPPARAQVVLTAKVDGAINPAVSEFLSASIVKAKQQEAQCLVVLLNTPGGLLKSTRVIVTEFLSADVPVVVYVAPPGSQAASAGVFITLAGHVAAMAPGTNIGAAHPVGMQGEQDSIMMEKATNDAAAFVRTIAEKRDRNIAWAEDAVRRSISITETEAEQQNVIDFVAKDLKALLQQIDGMEIELPQRTVVLRTAGAEIRALEMGWNERILDILSDPNIAYILLMLGVYGLLFELYNPGSILPGIVGVICLILGFYSLHTLPINYAGLALIIFSIILFLAEIKVTSYGLLTLGGIVSFVLGSLMLIETESALEFLELSWTLVVAVSLLTALFFAFVIGFGLRAQKKKPTTGKEGLVDEVGVCVTPLKPEGTVRVHGELWNARAQSGTLREGDQVRVVAVEDLTLIVRPPSNERSKKGV
jgi:membrane-bound serine protease (ClpP class)